ncbi:helix-turn-helix protein [Oesophagostomum dentatum]|uniref:Helix-turn-helix protein n=1 Tax=Oesophagostomum dentatum TaxID=61180 RepID=A0A0B1SAH4_OESDE|nr:helix-turn-helix protein [Oesophagostomum dentatum]
MLNFSISRKYDKNALDEAVRSVRRGEMSVHRAGSYYGVPHSTLEYKVKERNLLRKKKDSPPVKEISLMQEPITSLDISEESTSPAITV